MPLFELQGPDGAIYEVDAPDERAAASAFQSMNVAAPQPQPESMIPSAIADVPKEIGGAFNESVAAIRDGLAGQSDRRRANPPSSLLDALGSVVSDTIGTGKALAAIPGLIASPITGTARSLIGHPYSDLTGIPYEEAKGNVDTALMALGPKNFTSKGARAMPKPVPSADELRAAASAGFDAAKNSGANVPARDVQTLAQTAKSALQSDGFRDYLAPKTFSVLSELETPPSGASASIADLHGMRRVLGKAAMSPDSTERAAATTVIKELDRFLSGVSPQLKEAIGNYAALKRSDTIQNRMDRADLNAATANSGQNIDNAIRQQVKGILTNQKERRGYSKQEIELMESIAKSTSPANLVRGLGNLLGGGGGLGMLASGGVGTALAGPAGIAAPAIGWLAKQIGNRLTASKVRKLDEAVRSRSPLAQSMPPKVVPMPSPILGALVPNRLQALLAPEFAGQVPAYADEDQRRGR